LADIQLSLHKKESELNQALQGLQDKNIELNFARQVLQDKDGQIIQIEQSLQVKERELNSIRQELLGIYKSRSWRITRFLRTLRRKLNK
ncbi:hypothetical protein, partial [Phytopseudomonas seleniipraecipitans]|uniref:hypothetical protein n=1 Tax=Phytopseudomonas seleniipraecipitans TaxID=640205 RepID=UPI001428A1C9